ncbi:MAG TPA: MBL fold metallo-hydrolase [Nocardioides sp.]
MSTADAVSPDSDRPWATPGAWPVAPGVHRIPLPLPNDGLRAVNVYAIETADADGTSLTLVDGGWAITEADEALEAALASIGAGVGDIRRFLVTHVHRDHYTQAVALRRVTGAEVALGRGEEPSLRLAAEGGAVRRVMAAHLADAGAVEAAQGWLDAPPDPDANPGIWELPDTWIDGDVPLVVGSRRLDAVHTPGHTAGHYVFADTAATLLFAGDHVLPTITPSIGFEPDTRLGALTDFLASLAKVRALPDLRLLPAHGPVTGSSHARVDELLGHHETRLAQSLAPLEAGGAGSTAEDVARHLTWTRREHAWTSLDQFNAALAVMETRAHLEVLVARGEAVVERDGGFVDAIGAAAGSLPGSDPLSGVPARYRRA